MQLVVEVDSSGPQRLLDEMVGRLNRPRTLMTMLGNSLEEYEREVFASSGQGRWAPHDPDTLEVKGAGRLMVESGLLLRELTTSRVEGESVVVDSGRAFYARFLRDGDRGMPRRDAAPAPTSRHVQRWADQLIRFITTGLT